MDDQNVHKLNWEEHLGHFHYVFLQLKEINLKLNLRKCEFVRFSLTFLGHVVICDGTQLDPKKIK